MKQLYLVDGSGYIFRAYYAIAPLSNAKGLPTNAVYGFTRMLIKLLRDAEARYIAVTFDTAAATFRHQMYEGYKANRKECPEDLVPQMPYFRSIVQALGVQSLEKPGYEADDIIATLTETLKDKDTNIVIVSGDKDLTQLVNGNVEVWDAMRDIHFKPDTVKSKFGVSPEQMVDFLALVGDASDNVPGVKGVGPKSAQLLLEHFGTLENIIEQSEKIEAIKGLRGAASIRKAIESGIANVRLSRSLIELNSQVEPFNKVNSAEEFYWTGCDVKRTHELFDELEFSNLLETWSALPSAESAVTHNEASAKRYHLVRSEELAQFLQNLASVPAFAFDTETTSLAVDEAELAGISFSWKAGEAYYLPLMSEFAGDELLDRSSVLAALKPILNDQRIKKVGVNLKYDIGVLARYGIVVNGLAFDCMLASYVLSPDRREHGLKAMAWQHLSERMLSFSDLVGKAERITQVEQSRVSRYACHDADASWQLYGVLDRLLGTREYLKDDTEGTSLRRVFEDIEMPLVALLSKIEQAGIKVDIKYLEQLSEEFAADLATLEARIVELAGVPFNLNSPKQLSEILFERLGLPTTGLKRTNSGFSTDAGVLSRFAGDYEIVRHLLEYREVHKLRSTYVEALKRLANSKTARIHTSFNQAVAATGRLSSSEPNLQNIPIRNARGRRIRQAFIADSESVLISADYSQIELRILAHLSGDENLRQAFLHGEDIHMKTARDIFGEVAVVGSDRSDLRRIAKTINFGVIYGMSAFRLASELGISRKQAQVYIDNYFARYPRVRDYFERLAVESTERGFVETIFGRRRYLKDIDTTGRDAGYAGRSLANAPIQGSAADIVKLAMIKLDSRLESFANKARIVLQVHDELVVEAGRAVADDVASIVTEAMETAVVLSVPLKVDVHIGQSWGAMS